MAVLRTVHINIVLLGVKRLAPHSRLQNRNNLKLETSSCLTMAVLFRLRSTATLFILPHQSWRATLKSHTE